MGITHIAALGVSISFIGLGLVFRKQQKDWKAFFYGGVALLLLVVVALILGSPM